MKNVMDVMETGERTEFCSDDGGSLFEGDE